MTSSNEQPTCASCSHMTKPDDAIRAELGFFNCPFRNKWEYVFPIREACGNYELKVEKSKDAV